MTGKVSNELSGKTYDHQSRSGNDYEMKNHNNSNYSQFSLFTLVTHVDLTSGSFIVKVESII